jgi:hypothetical protein
LTLYVTEKAPFLYLLTYLEGVIPLCGKIIYLL